MKYDVIVIGGGPAGMMAAGRAAENGAKVLLLEKKRSLGNKLLITGNGRCNITNDINDHRVFAERLGVSGKFMLSALARFGVAETLEFFHSHSVPTVVEEHGKIFPESSSARDVLDALLLYLEDFKVEIMTDSEVISFVKEGSRLDRVILKDGQEFEADKFIVAAGGKSYPLTGSTGDVYRLIGSLGHHIVEPRPVLSGIMVNESLVKDMEGASLDDAELSLYVDGKKVGSERGEMIFTGVGVSGPAAIDFSRLVDEYSDSKAKINIDMVPSIDFSSLDVKLEKELQEELGRMIKNYLSDLVPPKVVPTILSLAKIGEERRCGEVTRDERRVIIHALKEVKLTFKSFGGFDRAMVTRGGIDLKEVDSKTMRSKIIDNLYFAGEILDLDGPTGGFNLQIAWSTGFAAGERV